VDGRLSPEQGNQSLQAIREIGTNAIPFLVDWIATPPSGRLRAGIQTVVARLPASIANNPAIADVIIDKSQYRVNLGWHGFAVLGPAAASAIPRLVDIVNATSASGPSQNAASALAYVGPQALEPLTTIARTPHHPAGVAAMRSISWVIERMPDRSAAVPFVISITQDTNTEVPFLAIQTLALFAHCEAARAAVNGCTQTLTNSNPQLRVAAAHTLGSFGTNALPAIPELVRALKDNDPNVRATAQMTLRGIAPEALINSTSAQP
jgi:HEAT repeat protein